MDKKDTRHPTSGRLAHALYMLALMVQDAEEVDNLLRSDEFKAFEFLLKAKTSNKSQ